MLPQVTLTCLGLTHLWETLLVFLFILLHEGVITCQGLCRHAGAGFWSTVPMHWVRCCLPTTLACTSRLRKTWPCAPVAEVLWVERCTLSLPLLSLLLSLTLDLPLTQQTVVLCKGKSDGYSSTQSQIRDPSCGLPVHPYTPAAPASPGHPHLLLTLSSFLISLLFPPAGHSGQALPGSPLASYRATSDFPFSVRLLWPLA